MQTQLINLNRLLRSHKKSCSYYFAQLTNFKRRKHCLFIYLFSFTFSWVHCLSSTNSIRSTFCRSNLLPHTRGYDNYMTINIGFGSSRVEVGFPSQSSEFRFRPCLWKTSVFALFRGSFIPSLKQELHRNAKQALLPLSFRLEYFMLWFSLAQPWKNSLYNCFYLSYKVLQSV